MDTTWRLCIVLSLLYQLAEVRVILNKDLVFVPVCVCVCLNTQILLYHLAQWQ